MQVLPAIAFLICHALALWLLPRHALTISYAFLVGAPLSAGLACLWRGRNDPAASGWRALALGMFLWAAGMASSMVMEIMLHNDNATPGLSMLCYVLYGVPLTYAMATPTRESRIVQSIDALLALAIGCLFFVHTFSFASIDNASDEGVAHLRMMFDIENVFIASFALLRWVATGDAERRAFFRTLTFFAATYLVAAGYINHFAQNTDYGGSTDLAIDVPFLLLVSMALSAWSRGGAVEPPRRLSHVVLAASPLMMPVTLLVISGLILRAHPTLALAGFVMAMLGYGVRSVLTQVRSLEVRDQLAKLSRSDPLTGIANRRQFDETLTREWALASRHAQGIALLLIDVDHFKQLNDGLGHPAGDAYLRAVADTIATTIRRNDDLVARYGGEEFAVLLPATTTEGAASLAEAVRAAIAERRLPMPPPLGTLTASIGLARVAAPSGREPQALVDAADAALYEAKRAGRNRVCQREL